MGQVVCTLPEGRPVHGVTSLAGEVFVLRSKGERDQLEVYDRTTYRSLRCLTVPKIRGFVDMTSCEHYQCIYISYPAVLCIRRLDSQGVATQWPINERPDGLSVNRANNLLVACWLVRKIKEFSTHGDLVREITLPAAVNHPWHAIQLTSGQFVVCHGSLLRKDPVHRVCVLSADGREIVHSHGGQPGSDTDECNVPCRLAVDQNECVYVVDRNNHRVKLLSPTLRHICDVVTSDLLKGEPRRLCLGRTTGHLYVADNRKQIGMDTVGRVVVFSV